DVEVPPAPELQSLSVDPKTTALLILDIQNRNCNAERRPRCVASLPGIQDLLAKARAARASASPGAVREGRRNALLALVPRPEARLTISGRRS
ncbi:MAG: hypothetical protein KAX80_12950, partial [Planctomycetes bacterium]|nr:hypothetical protein [Planctomycetota bacterium]